MKILQAFREIAIIGVLAVVGTVLVLMVLDVLVK
jgi:hypothetical protein